MLKREFGVADIDSEQPKAYAYISDKIIYGYK